MTTISLILLAGALAAAAPQARAAETPAPPQGQGGPYEPVAYAPAPILVEAPRATAWTIAPDPRLRRRYAPRERRPVNRINIPF